MQLLRLGLSFSPVGGVIKGAKPGTRLSGSVCPLQAGARGRWNAFVRTRGPGYVRSFTNSPPRQKKRKKKKVILHVIQRWCFWQSGGSVALILPLRW